MRCVSERNVGRVTVLDLEGRTLLGQVNTAVTDRVVSLAADGHRAFLLNLRAVTSLDSNDLGDLVGAREAAGKAGGTLKLLHVHERVAHPLRIMNLTKSFECFESEADALGSFGDVADR